MGVPKTRLQRALDLKPLFVFRGVMSMPMDKCVAVIVGIALFHSLAARAGQMDTKRPFTTNDSIEISYIVNPATSTIVELRGSKLPTGVPIISPDRKYFLLVTQRGTLTNNSLEATIWLFNQEAVRENVSQRAKTKPIARAVATLRASSNTPVVSEVRWVDPQRVSFLGKNNGPYQQLFVADLSTSETSAITKDNVYVTAYDISGDTIVYATLIAGEHDRHIESDLVDVTGKDLISLLYPNPQNIEDMEEWELVRHPSTLHVQRNGQEVPLSFTVGGEPLRLFQPTLVLSPDGKYLITVAPMHEIPPNWGDYQPYPNDSKYPKYMSFLRLKPGNDYALSDKNPWKVCQYVVVDLRNGQISPLVNGPVGRSLAYNAPTKAFWFGDSRRAILSSTFLPLNTVRDKKDLTEREQAPAVAFVDLTNDIIEPITYLRESPLGAKEWYRVNDISWDVRKSEVRLSYLRGPDPDQAPVPPFEIYRLNSGEWRKMPALVSVEGNLDGELELSVEQDLNHPPALKGHIHGSAQSVLVWDPNPQLGSISMAKASVFHWRDRDERSWSGLLVLPPDYNPKRRYPLVIQLYGYQADKFFVDGPETTGFAGRALAAQGIIVLQIESPTVYFRTPNDGRYQIEGFESAVEHLSADRLIDSHRVGVIGFSYSSYYVLYAITHRPNLFAAASFSDGNTVSYWQYLVSADAEDNMQGLSDETNGGAPFGPGLLNWLQNAPGFNLDKVKTALLICSLERGSLLYHWEPYAGLRTLKKAVDMVWLRKENWPHILVQPAHVYMAQQLAVDWFVFWLKGDENPDPAKAEQYARWRELRKLQKEE